MRRTASRLPLLAVLATVLALVAPGLASAQAPPLADVYPGAVPVEPPNPSLGAAPGVQPVPGQSTIPRVKGGVAMRNCERTDRPRGLPAVDARGVDPSTPNPLRGQRWFVDPAEPQFQAYSRLYRRGQMKEARLMWKVAGQPRFRWFGRWTRPNMFKKVREYLNCASALQPGTVPLMTVMRHQGKSCNPRYTAGGPAEDRATRAWYDKFADAVADSRVILAFEPDSLGTLECLKPSRRMSRLKNLRYGVDVLSKLPNATIYLEGGASDWEPAKRTARQLRYIGIRKVRGFMLNVTHYDWTGENIDHGLQISRMTGRKPFIVSTSFNGRGAVHVRRWLNRSKNIWRTLNVWCHPLRRGLGPAPTTATAHPKVDAYMWIGRPGYSGGSCNGGPLPVGSFWAERVQMFATYATNWLRPPRGARNGHLRRYSPRQLGFCGGRSCN